MRMENIIIQSQGCYYWFFLFIINCVSSYFLYTVTTTNHCCLIFVHNTIDIESVYNFRFLRIRYSHTHYITCGPSILAGKYLTEPHEKDILGENDIKNNEKIVKMKRKTYISSRKGVPN